MNCIICASPVVIWHGHAKCRKCQHITFKDSSRNHIIYAKEDKLKRYIDLEDNGQAVQLAALRLAWLEGAGLQTEDRILDIGCGIGTFLEVCSLFEYNAEGGDISELMVEEARNRHRSARKMNADKAVIGQDEYNVITMFDVIEHLENPMSVLKAIHRALKKDGIVAISTPNASELRQMTVNKWRHYKPGEHVQGFCEDSLVMALRQAKFEPIAVSYAESIFRPSSDGVVENILTVIAKRL